LTIGLRTKVFLPLFVLFGLLICYLYGYWMPQSLASIERRQQEATERHLESVAEGVVPLLLGRELDTIYENFNALLKKNADWTGITLTDASGRTLYPLEDPPAKATAKHEQYLRTLVMPITYVDTRLGTLTVSVNLTPYIAEWKREFHEAVLVMLVVIAVIVLSIGVVLELQVVHPVKALGAAAREMAKGKFDVMHLKAGDDEVGQLVDAFNSMREELSSSYNQLLESLEEKELLLHEIHHRVKNNMQVITSLLDLQLGYINDRDPKELFSEIKNRIRSMSLVHEKLYLAKDLSQVNFSDYLSTLVSNLYRFYNLSMDKIALNLDIRDISLGIDTAIPCGLIVNELITNALKYAFPGDRTGEILVRLIKAGETAGGRAEYELTVRDNGIGIADNINLKGIKTLGLYLVTSLGEHQLQGTVHLDRTDGTEFVIRFSELKGRRRV